MSNQYSDLEIRNITAEEVPSKTTQSRYLGNHGKESRDIGPAFARASAIANLRSRIPGEIDGVFSGSSGAIPISTRPGLRKSIGLGALAPSLEYMPQDRIRAAATFHVGGSGLSGTQYHSNKTVGQVSSSQLLNSAFTSSHPITVTSAAYLPSANLDFDRSRQTQPSSVMGGTQIGRSISTSKFEVSRHPVVSSSHTERHLSVGHLSTPPPKERVADPTATQALESLRKSRRSSSRTVKESIIGTKESIITHEPILVEVRRLEGVEISNHQSQAVLKGVYSSEGAREVSYGADLRQMLIESMKRIVLLGMENERVVGKNQLLEHTILELKSKLESQTKQISELEQYRTEYSRFKSRSESLEEKISEVLRETNQFMLEIERLRNLLDDNQREYEFRFSSYESTISTLRSEKESLGREFSVGQGEHERVQSELQQRILMLSSENDRLLLELKRLGEIGPLQIEIKNLQSRLTVITSERDEYHRSCQELQNENRRLTDILRTRDQELERERRDRAAADRKIDELEHEMANLRSTLNNKTAELESLQREYSNLERKLKAQFETTISNLTNKISYYEKVLPEHQNEIRKLQERLSVLERDLSMRTQELEQTQRALRDLESKHQQLLSELTTLRSANSALEQQVASLQQANRRLEDAVSELRRELQHLTHTVTELQRERDGLLAKLRDLQQEIGIVTGELTEARNEVNNLRSLLDRAKRELESLEEKVRELERIRRELLEENGGLKEEIGTLDGLLGQRDLEIERFKRYTEELNSELEGLKRDIADKVSIIKTLEENLRRANDTLISKDREIDQLNRSRLELEQSLKDLKYKFESEQRAKQK